MPTTNAASPDTHRARNQEFADFIRQAALEAGFDVESPRGGGKRDLARITGMSQTSVGRMLAGQTLPDPMVLERLAIALRLPLLELLTRSGVVSKASSSSLAATTHAPLDPAEAARRLGIKKPENVSFFETTVRMLLDRERGEGGG